jgi:hypothetical protein
MRPRNPVLAYHALADRFLDTALVQVPLDQPTQQLAPFRLHHRFQITVRRSLSFLVCESA